jgi:hypothetical protein
MAAESGCTPACHYWIARVGELNEPACNYYKTLCSAAMEKCRNELKKQDMKKSIIKPTSVWPGTNRGWGPVTRKLDWE